MNVLIVNAILYTSESKKVQKVHSIKDCMIYDLCIAFHDKGHEVTLIAADNYKPMLEESYPFEIVWMKSYFQKVFIPNKIPFNFGIRSYLKNHKFDLVICSEVFSLDTLLTVRMHPENLIIWQEMAFHQKMARQVASKLWYNVVFKLLYPDARIVARTKNARKFISKYSNNVSDIIIPHGVDLNKFAADENKSNFFIVVSQLIERKRVDRIIKEFKGYCEHNRNDFMLYIVGDGDKQNELENQVVDYNMKHQIVFTGRRNHDEIVGLLSKAKALLVYTRKDNSMISIAESIAVGTPVISTTIPDNAEMIRSENLGIVQDNWTWQEMEKIVINNKRYVEKCIKYRTKLDNKHNVDLFMEELKFMR